MPDKTEDKFNKIKEQIKAKKENAENSTSNNKSTSTSTSTSTDTSTDKTSNINKLNGSTSSTTSSGTSTNTSTNTSANLQQIILNYDLTRQMEYNKEDLKYASWQFTQDTLKKIKRKAEDLNVHQSQLMRYIVDRAFKEYL